MDKTDVFNLVKSKPNVFCIEKQFQKYFQEIYDDILKWKFPSNFKFSQKLYHYFYNDPNLNLGKCKKCGNQCRFRNFIYGYSKFCSNKCSNNSNEWKKKVSIKHNMSNHQQRMADIHISHVNKRMMDKYPYILSISKDRIYHCKCIDDNCSLCKERCFDISAEMFHLRTYRKNDLCTKRNKVGFSVRTSGEEISLYRFISSIYHDVIIQNDRKTLGNQLELDIYLPKLKLAFEYQGDIWHANPKIYDESFICPLTGRTYKDIHKHDDYKKSIAENKGIKIIYIWEFDWVHNRIDIENKIKEMII